MIKAAIIAGDHIALTRLTRLLLSHPDVELTAFCSDRDNGRPLGDIFPSLNGDTDLCTTADIDLTTVDVIFLATQPDHAGRFVASADLPPSLRIIDLSGNFRNNTAEEFVPGIAELYRKAMVRGATRVALERPETLALSLALLPLAKNLMLNGPIAAQIAVSQPCSTNGSLTARPLDADIADAATDALKSLQSSLAAPIAGTIFSGDIPSGVSAVVSLQCATSLSQVETLYHDFYDDHKFIRIVRQRPDTAFARGTNKCFINIAKDDNTLTVNAVFDNDIKGCAGNAIHAMNLLFGLDERVGLC